MTRDPGSSLTKWNHPFPPSSPGQVEQFEECVGESLPPAFRKYLLSRNGGSPSEYLEFCIPGFADDKSWVMLGAIYGIGKRGSGLDLETQYQELNDVVPQGHIPVGEDPGGNLLLMEMQEPSRGRIVFWDRVGLLARATGQNLFPVADDINHFLDSLRAMKTRGE